MCGPSFCLSAPRLRGLLFVCVVARGVAYRVAYKVDGAAVVYRGDGAAVVTWQPWGLAVLG